MKDSLKKLHALLFSSPVESGPVPPVPPLDDVFIPLADIPDGPNVSSEIVIASLREQVQALDEERKKAWLRCREMHDRWLVLVDCEQKRRDAINKLIWELRELLICGDL